ncbi:MAG TPA: glycosyltransferase [Actinomycetota bacterium]|nr:glycosyltransferase [Actinomycetota bacterium]
MTDLIVCSLEPWDEVWRRNQFLIAGLLDRDQSLRVLFVEPPSDPLHLLRIGQRPRLGRGLAPVADWVGRLQRLELTKWLPRTAGPMADAILDRAVRVTASRLGITDPLLWINDPGWAHLIASTGWPAIYDITDDWVEADRSAREHERIVANERALMDSCRLVVVCSPELARTKSRIRPVVLVQNAVDVGWYREPQPRPDDLGASPVALYAGTLHEDRLDVRLCCELGRRLHAVGAALVFVGPNALAMSNSELLASVPGVRILGPRPYRSIPGYLQHADLLVVPHLVNDFTNSLDPIKLYEYQAVARPIVATPVSGFVELDGLSGVAIRSSQEFPDAAVGMLAQPPEVGPFDVADWDDRVTAMARFLEQARRD